MLQLLLMEDQHVIQALSPDTQEKAFTDGIGSWCVIRCFQYLDAARYCDTSETGSKLAIVIANEILRAWPYGVASRSCCAVQTSVGDRVTTICNCSLFLCKVSPCATNTF